jgi:hypothetical protein
MADAQWVTAIVNIGFAVFVGGYLLVRGGPAERKELMEACKQALAEARGDYDRWKAEDRAATTRLIEVLGKVQADVLNEIKDHLSQNGEKVDDLTRLVNEKFNDFRNLLARDSGQGGAR